MKVRKLKTRIAAFGLAVLMGISTLSSVNAFAVEQTGSEQQTEVQAVTSQKDTSVTADDITKAVSDETFAVETCMERPYKWQYMFLLCLNDTLHHSHL